MRHFTEQSRISRARSTGQIACLRDFTGDFYVLYANKFGCKIKNYPTATSNRHLRPHIISLRKYYIKHKRARPFWF